MAMMRKRRGKRWTGEVGLSKPSPLGLLLVVVLRREEEEEVGAQPPLPHPPPPPPPLTPATPRHEMFPPRASKKRVSLNSQVWAMLGVERCSRMKLPTLPVPATAGEVRLRMEAMTA
jgi:hypothetical protein